MRDGFVTVFGFDFACILTYLCNENITKINTKRHDDNVAKIRIVQNKILFG
ncbi:hypothetical protein M2101_000719 [Parabacteroides sp. PM5-20]|nr:hypothetical protein [Parabacteroides sp. PM5-20]